MQSAQLAGKNGPWMLELKVLYKWDCQFLSPFMLQRTELANPIPTKGFLQQSSDTAVFTLRGVSIYPGARSIEQPAKKFVRVLLVQLFIYSECNAEILSLIQFNPLVNYAYTYSEHHVYLQKVFSVLGR